MNEVKYYDGTKLLSLKDLNGNTPEIFLCTGNKAAGKTTYYSRLMVRRYLNEHKKFALIYRYNYELDDIADKFFKDIGSLFFKDYVMKAERKAKGIYAELYIGNKDENPDNIKWESCGYGLTLNSSEQLKKYSHLLSDIDEMFFDEFQSETDHYCPHEIHKFQLLHSTVARGQGEQSKYVPVYMCSNVVSSINPYFLALGISNRIQKNTKYLRGTGWVLEVTHNDSAANAMKSSLFVQAFGNSEFNNYAINNTYLNDNEAFIEKMKGRGFYLLTIKYENNYYAVYKYATQGLLYVTDKPDLSFPIKIAVGLDDHDTDFMMIDQYNDLIVQFRDLFKVGKIRFKNQMCKDAFLKLVAIITIK